VISRQEALDYHSMWRKGKVEVIPSKPCQTQRDFYFVPKLSAKPAIKIGGQASLGARK